MFESIIPFHGIYSYIILLNIRKVGKIPQFSASVGNSIGATTGKKKKTNKAF